MPGTGKITSGLTKACLVVKTIQFVYEQLLSWRDDPARPHEQAEDKLNHQLCKFLDSRARQDFPMVRFDYEERQTGRRRVDLAASPVQKRRINAKYHTIYQPFLVLEGKRLPAPSAARQKEYVTGGTEESGGIQRFKLGLHGADLRRAVMIGYIQDNSSQHWYEEINTWIREFIADTTLDICHWDNDEVLEALDDDAVSGIAKTSSVHSRIGNCLTPEIEIHHLWIVMNQP